MSPLFFRAGGAAAEAARKSGGAGNQGYIEIEREYLSKMYIPGIRKGSNAKALWSFADTMAVFGCGSRSLTRDE